MDGLEANLTDAELTERAPLVIEGEVLSKETISMRDDPFLPDWWQSDPSGKRMVESGARLIKWRVQVSRWLKGTSAASIYVVRAASDAERFGDIVAGKRFIFWLGADEWHQHDHWILNRAQALA